jgi:ElaB/YqjD/DUF883 family membrane-anchored ribosome-binding protein
MAQASDDLGIYVDAAPTEESKPEEIRKQMAETRAALTEKLETLQERVEGTVEAAQASIEQTVRAVKRTFDLKYQVGRRPWVMVGASLLTGYTLGCLVCRRSAASIDINGAIAPSAASMRDVPLAREIEVLPPPLRSSVLGPFEEEIRKLKGVAIGAVMGLARDWLKEAVPAVSHQLDEVIDGATRKLGGEPIEGPIFDRAFGVRPGVHG